MGNRNTFIGILFGLAIAIVCITRRQATSHDVPDPAEHRQAPVAELVSVNSRDRSTAVESYSQPKPLEKSVTSDAIDGPEPVGCVNESLSLKELLRQSIKPASVRLPTRNQLTRFERLIAQSLRQEKGHVDLKLIQQWKADGWSVHICGAQRDVMVIAESPDMRCGRGIYAIRFDLQSNVFIQAPHRFYDTDSGLIARKLFSEQPIRAIAWNSVHRRQVDLSHTHNHFINAFTKAIVTTDQTSQVIQIHGFGSEQQRSLSGHVNAIVSNGTRFPQRGAIAATAELKRSLGAESVRLFPTEVERLGGTTNRQGSVMRDLGSPGFLHIELDSNYRDQLRDDASKRGEFFSSLTKHCKLPI